MEHLSAHNIKLEQYVSHLMQPLKKQASYLFHYLSHYVKKIAFPPFISHEVIQQLRRLHEESLKA